MRIVILGAGTVGSWIADLLCRERHSVTVVDTHPALVKGVNETLDVRALRGSASQSSVLFQADVLGADLCLAVTGIDEVNLVAAGMAKAMGARRTVARVYAPVFRDLSTFDYQRHFRIDRLLSLEHLSAMELARGIRNPGVAAVESFARGELEVQEIIVSERAEAIGVPLKELKLPKNVRIGSFSRAGQVFIAGANDAAQVGDHVMLVGRRDDLDGITRYFQGKPGPKKGVVIVGGGETGYHLARTLEAGRFDVLLMDASPQRCEFLAANLKRTTVVEADGTRKVVLEEERVGTADLFVACTGDDENNIMAGVEAREIGAKAVMAIVSRPDYASIVGKLGIDLAVSPRDVMAKQVMGFLNTGAVISRSSLADGQIAVLEVEVIPGAPATEHVLANLRLPSQCLVAGIMREGFAHVPGGDDRLQAGDTVVLMMTESVVSEALSLFNTPG